MTAPLGPFSTALTWAAAIARREVSPLEVLALYEQRIERFEPSLSTFTHRAVDETRQAAKLMEDRIIANDALPPFAGVPLPIKGLNNVAGWPNQYGSRGVAPTPVPSDDPFVARLRAAGFIFTGTTTSPEFGSVSVTESALTGATRNPWDLRRSPGGSSGGAAAQVAAGMAPIAHGSDGGGSIRTPASWCGLVGLKPSRGRVAAAVTAWPGLSTDGVLSRDVADTAHALDVLSQPDQRGWYVVESPPVPFARAVESDPRPQRIGIVRRPGFPVPVDDEAHRAVDVAAALLERLGHHVEEVELAFDQATFEELFIAAWTMSHGYLPGVDISQVEPLHQELHRRAQGFTAVAMGELVGALQQLSISAVSSWTDGTIDFALTPTTPVGPPEIGWLFEHANADPMSALHRAETHAGFTAPFNLFGLPAVSLPLHMRADGLPHGVQLVGGPRRDWDLLQLAAQLERAAPWSQRMTPPGYEQP
jgi:amidase